MDEIIQTDEPIEEPTEEPRPPRDIHHLMGLETYQGMTDEEIEIIINFRANLRAMGIAAEYQMSENALNQEMIEEQMRLNREQSQRNFEAACAMIEFKTVELEEV